MAVFKPPVADALSMGRSAKKQKKKGQVRAHSGPAVTVRKAEHKGHQIEIRTSYQIRVDGKPVAGHVEVSDSGHVHYHPLPNYSWSSAVDMVKQLIDSFPREFSKTKAPARKKQPGGGGHH